MAKQTYTATFTDGTTITRGTEREYGVAWRATWTYEDGATVERTGFARDQASANPELPIAHVSRRMSAADRALVRKQNEERLARFNYRVEFAPAVKA